MKESTRRAREQRKHDEALAQLLGIPLEDVLAQREQEDRDDKTREVQAIHLFLEKPEAFITKSCDECAGLFLTNYRFVSMCSSPCRIKSLEKIGIQWNPMHTATERWNRAQIPAEYSIPPEALKILLQIAQASDASHTEFPVSQAELIDEPSELIPSIEPSYNGSQESLVLEPPVSITIPEEDYLY